MPQSATQESRILAGTAKSDITPDVAVYLGGYGIGPVRRSKSIASRLYARAMAVSDGSKCVVLLAIDTHGLLVAYRGGPWGHFDIEEAVRDARPAVTGVFGASTHTHSGPDTTGVWGGLPPSERIRVVAGAVEAAIGAVDSLAETELRLGIADATDLLRNQCDFDPHRELDGRVVVIEAPGIGRAIVTSAHATVGSGRAISADWYGAAAKDLDDELGGVSLVLPGAIGRTQPALRGDGSISAVRSFAREMLGPVRQARSRSESLSLDGGIVLEPRVVSAPTTNPLLAAVSKAIGRRDPWPDPPSPRWLPGGETRAQVQALRLGPLLLAGFPGEAYPNLGWALEAQGSAKTVVPVSLVGDQIGYLIYPRSSYRRVLADAYKNDNSYFCVNPSVGERLLDAMADAAGAPTNESETR